MGMATNSFYKKIVNVVVCAAMCFAGSGCDFIYHLLQKEGAEEKELLGEVNALEKNENVEIGRASCRERVYVLV